MWHRASFWQPLQPWFVKETAFFFAKAQNLRIRLAPNSWDCYAGFCVAQSFVLASKYSCLAQTPCAKTAKSWAFCDSLPVSDLVCVFAFDTGGLGLWLGAFGKSGLFMCQRLSSRPSRRRVEGSCIGFWKSKANSTFCKVVKQKGEGKPTFSTRSFPLSLRPSPLPCGDQGSPPGPPMPCFVAQSWAFCGSLPVSASVCVFAFDTGGLGLWLGAFEKSGLYRCQSAPGPPMPCFVAQSFALCNTSRCLHSLCSVDMTALAAFATLVCQRNCVFLCKGTKLQKALLFAAVCRFFVTQSLGLCNTSRCLRSLSFGRQDRFGCFLLELFYLTVSFSGAKIL